MDKPPLDRVQALGPVPAGPLVAQPRMLKIPPADLPVNGPDGYCSVDYVIFGGQVQRPVVFELVGLADTFNPGTACNSSSQISPLGRTTTHPCSLDKS